MNTFVAILVTYLLTPIVVRIIIRINEAEELICNLTMMYMQQDGR